MIEKAIENWLINTNERNFLIPYCAVLTRLGHKVIYVSSNVQMEQGKDIITIDPAGEACAFQLKGGKIDTAEWRLIKGEVDELIELPIVHPSVDKAKPYKSFLVTNGEFTDPVRIQITQRNEDNRQKGRNYSYLDTVNGKTLVADFLKAQGSFFPVELTEIQEFLGFYLADGRDFLEKEKFAKFLEERVFAKGTGQISNKINAIMASVLMTAYALNNYQRHNNHYAAFEAWTILSASIVRFAKINTLKPEHWQPSYDLALMEIRRSLHLLKDEALTRTNFIEGDSLGDGGDVYRARITMVLGVLSAHELDAVEQDPTLSIDARVVQMVEQHAQKLWYWGEAAFSFLLMIIRLLERAKRVDLANGLRQSAFRGFLTKNSPNSDAGIPHPYYSAHEVIENSLGIAEEPLNMENFSGSSYVMENWIAMTVRREDRLFLTQHWRRISHIRVHEFIPDSPIDFFRWHVSEGANTSRFLNETQSWAELVKSAHETGPTTAVVSEFRPLLPFWVLVAPHRSNRNVINLIDNVAKKEANN